MCTHLFLPCLLTFCQRRASDEWRDRKSTRLNSSHGYISYAVFCLKKKSTRTSSAPRVPPPAIPHIGEASLHSREAPTRTIGFYRQAVRCQDAASPVATHCRRCDLP